MAHLAAQGMDLPGYVEQEFEDHLKCGRLEHRFLRLSWRRMKTILLQSYRTHDVPAWMAASMASVRAWGQGQGWDYEFMDDAFFTLAPDWVRERCAGNLYAVTDLCRLAWLQSKLKQGFERAIWADADLLVFAPRTLRIAAGLGHGFASELFLKVMPGGSAEPVYGVNNALMAFERGDPMLDAYLDACHARLRALPPGPVPRTALGPAILTELAAKHGLKRIEGVGLFSLAVMQDVARGDGAVLREYLRLSRVRPAAANHCHFLRNATPIAQRPQFDAVYDQAVQRLLATEGRF